MDATEWYKTHKKGAGMQPSLQKIGAAGKLPLVELGEIRDLVKKVADHRQPGSQDDIRVYKMFGNLSPDELKGVVIGMTFVMSVMMGA